MNNKSQKIDCNYVEQTLFQISFDKLGATEKTEIMKHIDLCENCKSSQQFLNLINQSMQVEISEEAIKPNPNIKEDLVKRMKLSKHPQNSLKDFFLNFFSVKIPLYQVITVLLLVGAITLFLNNKGTNFESMQNNVSIIAAIDSNTISMQFQNSLEWIDAHNKGKSILEDSVLANFMQSSM